MLLKVTFQKRVASQNLQDDHLQITNVKYGNALGKTVEELLQLDKHYEDVENAAKNDNFLDVNQELKIKAHSNELNNTGDAKHNGSKVANKDDERKVPKKFEDQIEDKISMLNRALNWRKSIIQSILKKEHDKYKKFGRSNIDSNIVDEYYSNVTRDYKITLKPKTRRWLYEGEDPGETLPGKNFLKKNIIDLIREKEKNCRTVTSLRNRNRNRTIIQPDQVITCPKHLKRMAEIADFLKDKYLSSQYFHNEMRRILRTRVIIDDLRAMVLYIEHPHHADERQQVLKLFARIKKEEEIRLRHDPFWDLPTNNLVLHVIRDPPNDGFSP